MSMDLPPLPAAPDPVRVAQWAGQVRTAIAVLGGLGIGGAWLQKITDAQISGELTAFLTVAGFGLWAFAAIRSWWAHRKQGEAARAAEVAAAVASAHATLVTGAPTPVTVAPVPPGDTPVAVEVPIHEAVEAAVPAPGTPPQQAP